MHCGLNAQAKHNFWKWISACNDAFLQFLSPCRKCAKMHSPNATNCILFTYNQWHWTIQSSYGVLSLDVMIYFMLHKNLNDVKNKIIVNQWHIFLFFFCSCLNWTTYTSNHDRKELFACSIAASLRHVCLILVLVFQKHPLAKIFNALHLKVSQFLFWVRKPDVPFIIFVHELCM